MEKRGLIMGAVAGALGVVLFFGAMAQGQSKSAMPGLGRFQAVSVGTESRAMFLIVDTETGRSQMIDAARESGDGTGIYPPGGKKFKFE